MELFHNSQSEACRTPLGAVKAGTTVLIKLFVRGKAAKVYLRTWNGGEKLIPMEDTGLHCYAAEIQTEAKPGLIWYDFRVEDERGRTLYYGNARDKLGGVGTLYQDPPPSFQLTVYDPAFNPPSYLREGILYQIFPDRFYASKKPVRDREDRIFHETWDEIPLINPDTRSNDNMALDFFGGDLDGIRMKLPYLKELGITVLYLNPIFKARSNHRYDTGDYQKIDPLLGDSAAFIALCKAAKELGIHVLLDGVFSHTGEDSIYFNRYGRYDSVGAYQSKRSPYYSWYRFTRHPDKYAAWWGIPTLPEINKEAPSYRKFMFDEDGVARNWVRKGSSGWRLDVADELPMDFLKELKTAVKAENPEAVLLGEVWEDASNKVSYGQMRCYCLGDTLDTVMNYPLRDALIRFLTGDIDAPQVVRLLRSLQENYPPAFFYSLMNLVGSHDRPRILNMLVKREYENLPNRERGLLKLPKELRALAISRFQKLMSLLVSLPGMPSLYYGDEAGMEGAADPYCRGTFPWGKEDIKTMEIVKNAFALRHSRPVLRSGFFEIASEGHDTLLISRSLSNGLDAFGEAQTDSPYTLRLTRDAYRV